MLKKFKILTFLFLVVTLCFVAVTPALAISSPGPNVFIVSISNSPENAVYADILIPIRSNDDCFTQLNQGALRTVRLKKSAQIIAYDEAGYRSFTFHYRSAKSMIKIQSNYVYIGGGNKHQSFETQFNDLINTYKSVKIALLDKDGNILSVSSMINISESDNYRLTGKLYYDAAKDIAQVDTSPYSVSKRGALMTTVLTGFVSIIKHIQLIVVAVIVEIFIALLFQFKRKQLGMIALVNLVTQIILYLLSGILPLSYWITILILEAFIYATEYVAFKLLFKNVSTKKLLFFVATANTASLMLGLLIAGL